MQTKSNTTQISFGRGLIYGLGITLAGAVGWAIVAYILGFTFMIGAAIIGFIIAYAVSIGTGDINWNVLVSTFVLTIISVLLGDFIYILLILLINYGAPFNIDLIALIIANFITIEIETGGITSFLFAVIGATIAVFQLSKQKQEQNRVRGFLVFTENRSFICWSPRFMVPVKLAPTYRTEEELSQKMSEFGFSITRKAADVMVLTRTNRTTEIQLDGTKAKLMVDIPVPIEEEFYLFLSYAKNVSFDTGDLWKVAKSLKTHLES
ncbi:MAG: hypothetical protein ACFFBD_05250 [Candidatus Hodarchaeota archaeon]